MPSPPADALADLDVTREAYYGTSQIEAAAILEGRFLPRYGEEQYLGTGIYFFDQGPDDAVRWAQHRSPGEWAVLRCAIKLGRCLDLHTRTGSELLAQLVRDLSAARREDISEAGAIKLLARFTAIDTVRAVHRRPPIPKTTTTTTTTPGGNEGWRGASSTVPANGLQTILCVRNLANIQHVETFRIGD